MKRLQESQIQQAISEAKSGNKDGAIIILSKIVVQEPKNVRACFLLVKVVEKSEHARYCLEKVLKLQPDNQQSKHRI